MCHALYPDQINPRHLLFPSFAEVLQGVSVVLIGLCSAYFKKMWIAVRYQVKCKLEAKLTLLEAPGPVAVPVPALWAWKAVSVSVARCIVRSLVPNFNMLRGLLTDNNFSL